MLASVTGAQTPVKGVTVELVDIIEPCELGLDTLGQLS